MDSSESQGSGKSGGLSHFEYQECPTRGLQDGDTTLMLRGLVRSINLEGFLKLLRNISSNYDLVYVPVGNKRSTNLGLAFVNYDSPSSARRAFEQLYQARSPHTFRMVKRAYVQGLGPNLAFVLSSGDAPLAGKHGMAVFQGGQRIKDVTSLVQRSVTDDMLAEAHVLMARIQTEQKEHKERKNCSSEPDGSVVSADVQSSTSGGSSGRASRATWSVERTTASDQNLLSQGVGPVGSRMSNFIDAEEVRQMTGGKGIPGSWYWQHDIPGYRGTYQEEPPSMHARALPSPCALAPAPSMVPAPTPLSDRFRLSWEASAELQLGTAQRQADNGLQPYQRLVFDL